MTTKELIDEAISLPVEERVLVADSILQRLHPVEDETNRKWMEVAKRRRNELRSGEVKAVPGEEVFRAVFERLSK